LGCPDFISARSERGKLYLSQGEFDKALQDFLTAAWMAAKKVYNIAKERMENIFR
jgi:hypothetical protein